MTLSILIWLPAVASLVAMLVPRRLSGVVTLAGAAGALGIAIGYAIGFGHHGARGLHYVTDVRWIPSLGIHYKLGLDGLNTFLILLATVVFAAAVVAAIVLPPSRGEAGVETAEGLTVRPRMFFFWLALGESAVLGAFSAQDLILFVGFFDLMLIPFYFLVGQFGGENRIAATTKLVIYTLVGSLLMLAAAIATGVIAAGDANAPIDFTFTALQHRPLPLGSQEWIVPCFAAAFLVKMPAFPIHGWLPDGYRAMPLPALAAFSGVLSKVGAYGFLRVVLPLFPQGAVHWQTVILLIALASILYGSAMAVTTTQLRLVVGYSSIAQLGFITLGIFSLDRAGGQGALLQMVNHGMVTAPLFFIVALLALRAGGSEDLRDMGGLAFRGPVLAAIFLIVALATLAMPGSGNFIGEFFILLGVFRTKIVFAIVAFAGMVMASVYMLRAFIRAMHNRVGPGEASFDLTGLQLAVLAPLVLVILALAFYPQVVLHTSQAKVYSIERPTGGLAAAVAGGAAADGRLEAGR